MNISTIIIDAIRKHGANIQLIDDKTLRLHHADAIPQHLIQLTKTYKPQLIAYFRQDQARQLIENLHQEGANLQLIDCQTLRLTDSHKLDDSYIQQVKRFKPDLIHFLQSSQEHSPILQEHFTHEVIQTYFDRLEKHRNNLRKIQRPINNALVRPKDLIQDLTTLFCLQQHEAEQIISHCIELGVFKYDSPSKFYLFPNDQHIAIQPFKAQL